MIRGEGSQPKKQLAGADPGPSNHIEEKHDDGGKHAGRLHEHDQVRGLQMGSHETDDHIVNTPNEGNGSRRLRGNEILRILQQMPILTES